ncbi:MAG: hypothetical protein AB7I13_19770 [Vicinamibacterales bacterium]
MTHCRVLVLGLVLALAATGCNSASPSNNQTVEFTGVLQVAGLNWHDFTTSRNGEYSVKVTALSPNPAALIGIYLGNSTPNGCSQFSSITEAGLNTASMTGGLNRGNYCLGIIATQSLRAATNYTVQLSHP